jgi:hypothetical protein
MMVEMFHLEMVHLVRAELRKLVTRYYWRGMMAEMLGDEA